MAAAFLLALSACAVAVRVAGYPDYVPRLAAHLLDAFVEPGVTIWWFGPGTLFVEFPHTTAGYATVSIGNTLFWMACLWAAAALLAAIRRRLNSKDLF
jgi:hypothetical protein